MAENSPIKSVLPKHYQTTLKNGLEVVVIPLKNQNNVITTNVFYKVGSRNETMGKSGIAHMLEHLNFKSTKNLKAGEFDRVIKGFGGSTNAATSLDLVNPNSVAGLVCPSSISIASLNGKQWKPANLSK